GSRSRISHPALPTGSATGPFGSRQANRFWLISAALRPGALAHRERFWRSHGLVFQRRLGRRANPDRPQRGAAMVHHSYLHRPWRGIAWRASPPLFKSLAQGIAERGGFAGRRGSVLFAFLARWPAGEPR